MATVFETLYDLAVAIQVDPTLQHLTSHHIQSKPEAEARLQREISELVTPVEWPHSSWHKLRIFCRSFVSPKTDTVTDLRTKAFLDSLETRYDTDEERIGALVHEVSQNLRLSARESLASALVRLCSATRLEPLDSQTYLEWLNLSWLRWQPVNIEDFPWEEFESDLHFLLEHPDTKLPGLTFGKVVCFFSAMGITAFAPLSANVTALISCLTFGDGEKQAFKDLVRIVQIEKPKIRGEKFSWLNQQGGLTPHYMGRLINVILNDTFDSNSRKFNNSNGLRLRLIKDALVESEIISSRYYRR